MLDLSGHHRMAHAGLVQDPDARAKVAERHPVQRGSRLAGRRVGELRKPFPFDRDDRYVVALHPGRIEHQEGKAAVAGNETEAHLGDCRLRIVALEGSRADYGFTLPRPSPRRAGWAGAESRRGASLG